MNPTSPDIPLHDIKPLMEVPDTSLYLFSALVIAALLLIAGGVYLFWRLRQERRRFNLRKASLAALQALEFSDAKAAAYAITSHGRIFAEDSARHAEAFANLTERLSAYKYKKEVGEIDDEALGYYRNYLEMIDV